MILMIAGSMALGWIAVAIGSRRAAGVAPVEAVSWDSLSTLDPAPIVLSPAPPAMPGPGGVRLGAILRKVELPPGRPPASYCLHALSAHGLDARFDDDRIATGFDLLRVFTDDQFGRSVLGSPAMLRTRHGIRPAGQGEGRESHYDQTLGCLAQLGIALSTPIAVGRESLSIREVLADSLASFALDEGEIEWTSIAYASYLPPRTSWTNKFGDVFNFDQLTDELLSRDLSRASCCGCHIVDALILILRVDAEFSPLLGEAGRTRARERVAELLRAAGASQGSDGAWEPDWFKGSRREGADGPAASDEALAGRLLATSHVAHWMMTLDAETRPPASSLLRAIEWISRTLEGASPEFVAKHYCPSSHGAWVIRIASGPAEPTAGRPAGRSISPMTVHREGPTTGRTVGSRTRSRSGHLGDGPRHRVDATSRGQDARIPLASPF